MTIDSFEVVLYTCIFLLPGYIIEEIIGALMPVKTHSDSIKVVRFIGYSVFNLSIWSWVYMMINTNLEHDKVIYWVVLAFMTLLTSGATGMLIGIIRKKGYIRSLFKIFNIQIEHPIPTAWDYKFSNTKCARWVIVTLSGGEVVYGKYSVLSLSSSDVINHDLY